MLDWHFVAQYVSFVHPSGRSLASALPLYNMFPCLRFRVAIVADVGVAAVVAIGSSKLFRCTL